MTSGFFYKQQQVVNVDCSTNESVGSVFWFDVINCYLFSYLKASLVQWLM